MIHPKWALPQQERQVWTVQQILAWVYHLGPRWEGACFRSQSLSFLLYPCPWVASTTTKARAVFDASAKSNNGVALNDILETGPNLYPLLTDVLIHFRFHRIGLTADINKMFWEILFHDTEKDLHCFFIREPDGKLQDCRMKRLTFGIEPSPYLAMQVIQHLAKAQFQTQSSQTFTWTTFSPLSGKQIHWGSKFVTYSSKLEWRWGNRGWAQRSWGRAYPTILVRLMISS